MRHTRYSKKLIIKLTVDSSKFGEALKEQDV